MRGASRVCRSVAVSIVFLLSTTESGVVASPSAREQEAGRLAKDAFALFKRGEHCKAAALFLGAHQLSQRPVTLKNAAKAYEKCGDDDQALLLWSQYRDRTSATSAERAEARARIEAIEEQRAARMAPEALPTAVTPAVTPTNPAEHQTTPMTETTSPKPLAVAIEEEASTNAGPYIVWGAGSAAAIGGAAAWLIASSQLHGLNAKLAIRDEDGLIIGISSDAYDAARGSIATTRRISAGLWISSAVLLVAGTVWLLVD